MVSAVLSGGRSPGPEAVVIGGSAGSLHALTAILPRLPATFLPVLVVIHVLPSSTTALATLFARRCAMRVEEAAPGRRIERGHVYFAPADYHLLVETSRRCSLSVEPPVHFSRPSIDVLFESAAYAYGARLVGVILTGASADGASGARAVAEACGRVIVQDPASAEADTMPAAALAAVPGATVAGLEGIAAELCALELQ